MFDDRYFHIQKLTFAGVGIDPTVVNYKNVVKRPLLCYGLIFGTFFHLILILHFVATHITQYDEVADSFPLLCQAILTIWKMAIFLGKRKDIIQLINELNHLNLTAEKDELKIVQKENLHEASVAMIYFRIVFVTGTISFTHPVIYGLYVYFTSGQVVFVEANKATYFWDYSHVGGYTVVFFINFISCYYVCDVSLAIDTLFTWFARNILAQYQILIKRFQQTATACKEHTDSATGSLHGNFFSSFVTNIQHHRQTLALAERLNQVYGEIIFIKFIIVCTEICSLVFIVSRPNYSMFDAVYKVLFLSAVTLQLSLYCYNGQRIKDESLQVSIEIYTAFDWSLLSNSYQKLLLLPIMRSQRVSRLKGVFFEVDLSLYLWVLKTAGSLLTALKTLEEKQV